MDGNHLCLPRSTGAAQDGRGSGAIAKPALHLGQQTVGSHPTLLSLITARVLKEKGRALFVWELAGYDDSKSVPPWVVQITTGKSY